MAGCKNCSGNCDSCAGCNVLELTDGEIDMLQTLAQIPFLPVVRKADSDQPIYPDGESLSREQYSGILLCLEKKDLIRIDYDMPIKGTAYSSQYPIHGSMALTGRGQQVLELLDIQGIS